ncbi:MAG: TorF family putative porin [Hyphomicrobiales bacterium]
MLGAALIGGLALPAQAEELGLSATATFTTDYVFRGISQTQQNPAVQAEFDATYGIFYLGMWGSNVDFGGTTPPDPLGIDLATVEIDYYGGIAPTWQGISFDIGGLYYTYPGAFDPGGEFDYFELKTAASYTFFEALTLGVSNYWSPEFFGETGDGDALELSAEYAFANKLFNFFSPSVGGLVGWQWVDDATDYTYWNVGLTLGFLDNWSADIRYWDTDLSDTACGGPYCDARVVGTISASF